MSDQLNLDGAFINSLVGEGARFDGDIALEGLFRVDGDFSGRIRRADKVLIGKNGRAECSIRAGTVVIGGVVKGDIVATGKVVVLSTGMVIGNITAPRLYVEEGVVLHGSCTISREVHSDNQDEQEHSGMDPKQSGDINRYNPLGRKAGVS
jgi:cytoskeletal protein CcmA (bactofilin family)